MSADTRANRKVAGSVKASGAPQAGISGARLGAETAKAMILEGAGRVFSEQGVRAVSVETLLGEAGLSRRTFYRFYKGKEAVMEALYRDGVETLISASRAGAQEPASAVETIERCIDAHLNTARSRGRLMYVLGGEAQSQESLLYPHRLAGHDALVELMVASAKRQKMNVDPLLFRSLFLAIESLTRKVLEEGDEGRTVDPAAIERARRVLMRLGTAALAGEGPGVSELPPA